METRLERLLAEGIDWDLKEPTGAQLKYAILVAKQTGTPLPIEAKKFRFYTAMFLETYAVQAKESSSAAKRSIIGSVSEMIVAGTSESDSSEMDSISAEGPLECNHRVTFLRRLAIPAPSLRIDDGGTRAPQASRSEADRVGKGVG